MKTYIRVKFGLVLLLSVDSYFSASRTHHAKRYTTGCDESQFPCTSGECIDAFKTCNGAEDCEDGSDEDECQDFTCPTSLFRCKYGACVDTSSTCNGVKDCLDGSDEVVSLCNSSLSAVPDSKNPSKVGSALGCELPFDPPDKIFNITNKDNVVIKIQPDNRNVPRYSYVNVTCKPGYLLDGRQKTYRSICDTGQWLPPLRPCLKACPALHPENALITCQRFGFDVDCKKEMINGTVVRPRCKEFYTEEKEVDYGTITCMENGEWDNPLYKCVLVCGFPHTVAPLIAKGETSALGETPWHVAIYRIPLGHLLICGGSLISPRLVISAAHCFYDDGLERAVNFTEEYEIVVGKHTRDYNKTDNSLQKKHKVKQLIFSDRGYNPNLSGHHGGDIIIIVLEESVTIGRYVLPVCIAWNADPGFNPEEPGITGRLVGWGSDDKSPNVGAAVLKKADLPYISYSDCVGQLQHITLDKFCAGSVSGAGARKGDSGGGLVFRNKNNNRYYLRGVVSTADKESNSSIATFTDISWYLDWIKRVRTRIEKESVKGQIIAKG